MKRKSLSTKFSKASSNPKKIKISSFSNSNDIASDYEGGLVTPLIYKPSSALKILNEEYVNSQINHNKSDASTDEIPKFKKKFLSKSELEEKISAGDLAYIKKNLTYRKAQNKITISELIIYTIEDNLNNSTLEYNIKMLVKSDIITHLLKLKPDFTYVNDEGNNIVQMALLKFPCVLEKIINYIPIRKQQDLFNHINKQGRNFIHLLNDTTASTEILEKIFFKINKFELELDRRDNNNLTPLELMIDKANYVLLKILYKYFPGLKLNEKNYNGISPIELVEDKIFFYKKKSAKYTKNKLALVKLQNIKSFLGSFDSDSCQLLKEDETNFIYKIKPVVLMPEAGNYLKQKIYKKTKLSSLEKKIEIFEEPTKTIILNFDFPDYIIFKPIEQSLSGDFEEEWGKYFGD